MKYTWLVGQGHPSEKYDFVNWDDNRNPIFLGKYKIDGNQSPPTSHPFYRWIVPYNPYIIPIFDGESQIWWWIPNMVQIHQHTITFSIVVSHWHLYGIKYLYGIKMY